MKSQCPEILLEPRGNSGYYRTKYFMIYAGHLVLLWKWNKGKYDGEGRVASWGGEKGRSTQTWGDTWKTEEMGGWYWKVAGVGSCWKLNLMQINLNFWFYKFTVYRAILIVLYFSLTPLTKQPSLSVQEEARWASQSFWHCGEGKKYLASAGNRTPISRLSIC
jgi:hypothetical protein